jgi:hypothetical protein
MDIFRKEMCSATHTCTVYTTGHTQCALLDKFRTHTTEHAAELVGLIAYLCLAETTASSRSAKQPGCKLPPVPSIVTIVTITGLFVSGQD